MSSNGLLTSLFFSILLLSATLALALDSLVIADFSKGVDEDGVPLGWELKEKSGDADLSVIVDGDIQAVYLRSFDTSFAIQKEVDIDLHEYPLLTWKWKVTRLPRGGDFRKHRKDDQAAQLFLAFSKTRIMVYIWDSTAPQGLMAKAPAPPFVKIRAIVVRSGPGDTGKWITETRNVYEDYKKVFGKEPKPVVGMRIQINSQHTGTSAESYFAEVMFKKK